MSGTDEKLYVKWTQKNEKNRKKRAEFRYKGEEEGEAEEVEEGWGARI